MWHVVLGVLGGWGWLVSSILVVLASVVVAVCLDFVRAGLCAGGALPLFCAASALGVVSIICLFVRASVLLAFCPHSPT
jgi:hypothetical protein